MERNRRVWTAASLLLLSVAIIYVVQKTGGAWAHPILAARLIAADTPSNLPVPVTGVRPRQLMNSWGFPRAGGRRHQGIDIFARRGTPIVSTTRGIVVTVGTTPVGGRIVRILGPGGQWHYYAHLERFADGIRPGDVLRAGAVIGYVGDSGNARGTPPHLHYGIYRFRGGAINPYPLLARTSVESTTGGSK